MNPTDGVYEFVAEVPCASCGLLFRPVLLRDDPETPAAVFQAAGQMAEVCWAAGKTFPVTCPNCAARQEQEAQKEGAYPTPITLAMIPSPPADKPLLAQGEPLELRPAWAGDWLVVREPSLGLYETARTRAELVHSVHDTIAFLWRAYAQADDDQLAPDAVILANKLRRMFKE